MPAVSPQLRPICKRLKYNFSGCPATRKICLECICRSTDLTCRFSDFLPLSKPKTLEWSSNQMFVGEVNSLRSACSELPQNCAIGLWRCRATAMLVWTWTFYLVDNIIPALNTNSGSSLLALWPFVFCGVLSTACAQQCLLYHTGVYKSSLVRVRVRCLLSHAADYDTTTGTTFCIHQNATSSCTR